MAKISPVSIKYMIYATFEVNGKVEKPDIVGALFGQTEGLLGSDLEMRRLQKEGKIGRIEVSVESKNGKTTGKIEIPSALDMTETTLVGAAIETIEKIGPSESKIKVGKVEDVRKNKRDYLLKRAKELLEGFEGRMPKSKEIISNLEQESRIGRIKEYGEEKLPAGNLDKEEIIIVEGRADVVNLLRNSIDNVIGMDGTKLPEDVKKISKEKKAVLFVDGDRGGKLIARNVIDNADINFVAFAPDGKEVEELTGKEILSALRKKIPSKEFKGIKSTSSNSSSSYEKDSQKEVKGKNVEDETNKLREMLEKAGTKKAFLLDENFDILKEVSSRGVSSGVSKTRKKVYAIVVEKATPGIIRVAEKENIRYIIAKNFTTSSEKVELVSL